MGSILIITCPRMFTCRCPFTERQDFGREVFMDINDPFKLLDTLGKDPWQTRRESTKLKYIYMYYINIYENGKKMDDMETS